MFEVLKDFGGILSNLLEFLLFRGIFGIELVVWGIIEDYRELNGGFEGWK